MNILLLNDEGDKLRYISNYLVGLGHECEQVNDVNSMKNRVTRKNYDVVIIDLQVPMGDEEQYDDVLNGFAAIDYLRATTDTIFHPKKILVISQYVDKNVIWRLNAHCTNGIMYDGPNGNWKEELKKELDYIALLSKKKVDLIILSVVENEKLQIEKIFDWEMLDVENDPLQYYYCEVSDKSNYPLNLIHCHIGRMGAVAAAQATARVIELFEPNCVIMCGIAGGRRNKTSFGDIVVADSVVDFVSGSIEGDTEEISFFPDSEIIAMDPKWVKKFKNYKENKFLLREIRDTVDVNGDYKNDICIHIGKMATGSAVIKSESFSEKYIRTHNRQFIAIDMETYGVYYTARNLGCKYISLKCISDHANSHKDDKYQKYAAALAANLLKYYILTDYKKEI